MKAVAAPFMVTLLVAAAAALAGSVMASFLHGEIDVSVFGWLAAGGALLMFVSVHFWADFLLVRARRGAPFASLGAVLGTSFKAACLGLVSGGLLGVLAIMVFSVLEAARASRAANGVAFLVIAGIVVSSAFVGAFQCVRARRGLRGGS
jgi:hypothetical protein